MMKDIFGQLLQEGDRVAYAQTGYRSFAVGVISKLGAAKVTITRHDADGKLLDQTFRFPRAVVKKP